MAKRVFLIHGWDFNPSMNWYPWLKKELENRGFQVKAPEMPNTAEPEINAWVNTLKKEVGKLDENTYFIGHSIGCQAIMRFLEQAEGKAGGAVFVAGWFYLDNMETAEEERIAEPWITLPIDFSEVKNHLSKLTVLLSSNEPYGKVEENKKMFENKLKAKVIILQGKGHFTADDGCKELPEALKLFLELAKE